MNLKVHGSVHRNNILIYIQKHATLHILFYLETALHISGGTITHHQERKTTVSAASGICHTVTAVCRYRGRVGTGLSVLWVAYAYWLILQTSDYPYKAYWLRDAAKSQLYALPTLYLCVLYLSENKQRLVPLTA